MKKLYAFLLLVLCGASLAGCHLERDFTGYWKDVDSDYALYVDGDTLTDNVFGLGTTYQLHDRQLQYIDPSTDVVITELKWDGNNKVSAYANGKFRTFERQDGDCFTSTLLSAGAEPKGDKTIFERKSNVGPEIITLYDNGVCTVDRFRSVAACSISDGSVILYYYSDVSTISSEVLLSDLENGFVYGYLLENDGKLYIEPKYANVTSEVPSGYTLEGVALYEDLSVTFTFTPDGKCSKKSDTGDVTEYNYSIGADGLITLGEVNGVVQEYDYMYLDTTQGRIYRVVYSSSSWGKYLKQLTDGSGSTSVETDGNYSVSNQPRDLLYQALQSTYIRNPEYIWGSIGQDDSYYTMYTAASITAELERIAKDDIARREREQALKSEREKFLEQVRQQEEAQRRLRAEMDARVQADIESGQYTRHSYQYGNDSSYAYDSQTGYDVDSGFGNPVTANDTVSGANVVEPQQTDSP